MLLSLLLPAALAAPPPESAWADGVLPRPDPPTSGFTFVGLVQTRAVDTSIVTTNPFLDGQVVGTLGGLNGSTVIPPEGLDLDGDGETDEKSGYSHYVEQRVNGFFTYAPPVWEGKAALNAAFEIDFLWGDQAYGVAGNTGGGFGGDQVNLQTRRLNATFKAKPGPRHSLTVVSGLQFVADGVNDPAKSRLDDLLRMGGGLRFFGSEAAGLSVYGKVKDASGERLRYRLGAYDLVEKGVGVRDDIALLMGDLDWVPAYGLHVGGHGWVVRDRSGGSGGFFGYGPTSTLSGLQGGPMLDLRTDGEGLAPEVDADLTWLAADLGYNQGLDKGPLGASVVAVGNVGKLYVKELVDVPVAGWLVDAEARLRWRAGMGSILRVEALKSSRDGTDPATYQGVITGNAYGIAGATWGSHGALILFPDTGAINRSTPVVADVSGGGAGLTAVDASGGVDILPHKLVADLGVSHARDGFGEAIGTEVHGRLKYQPLYLLNVTVAGATVSGTDLPDDPWMLLAGFDWVVF